MKKGIMVVNGYYINEAMRHQRETICAEFQKRGVVMSVVKNNSLPALIVDGEIKLNIEKADFVLYLDKDLHLARMLEKYGLTLINSAKSIELCDDKLLTAIALSGANIPMPKTIASPLMYRESVDSFANEIEKELDYPIVVKESFGSMGAGIHKAENRNELVELREKLKFRPHLYQEFIGKGGEDIRVIVIGGEVIAAMRRRNENDFRSNIDLGGLGESVELTARQKQMALKCAEILGLDYAGIDIIYDGESDYICEVNSNAFFKGIEKSCGINVAECYVSHIMSKIYDKKQ